MNLPDYFLTTRILSGLSQAEQWAQQKACHAASQSLKDASARHDAAKVVEFYFTQLSVLSSGDWCIELLSHLAAGQQPLMASKCNL